MPKRKKMPAFPNYIDGGRNPHELLIQKSNPLQSLSETSMTLPELKILDAYLSRINSHDDEARFVRLEKGELEKLLGVTRILKDDLSKRLDNLFQSITIHDENKPKGFIKIGLFEKAVCEQDENGLWQIDLVCSASAMQYVFNVENLGYLKYRLHNVINLTSRYSYVLYLYLEKNRRFRSWEVDLKKLKSLLNCTTESYNQFKVFNDRILKLCQKELLEKTEIRYTYELIKKGRKVVAIKFILETLPKIEEADPNQITIYDYEKEHIQSDYISFLQVALCPEGQDKPEFNREETKQINEILVLIPDCKLPTNVPTGDIEFRRYHYLAYQYSTMNRKDTKSNPIKNRFAYFIKMLKTDAGIKI